MRTPPRLLLVLLGVLLIAVGVAYVLVGDDESAPPSGPPPVLAASGDTYVGGSLPDDGADPVAVAVEVLPLALGYDYRTLDEGLEAATALMTDDFGADFARTFQDSAAELARTQKAVTQATVRAAGVVDLDDERAVCLVYVDQALVSSTTLENADAPVRVSQNRVLVGLVRQDDAWRVESIEPF